MRLDERLKEEIKLFCSIFTNSLLTVAGFLSLSGIPTSVNTTLMSFFEARSSLQKVRSRVISRHELSP